MADETPSTNFDFTPKLRIWWDINIYQLHSCAGREGPPQLQKPLIQTPSCLEDGHLWIIDDPQIGRQVEVLFLTGNRMKTSFTTFSKKTCESFLVLAEAMGSTRFSTWSWSSYAQWRPGPFCPLNPSNNKWRCIGARESGWTAPRLSWWSWCPDDPDDPNVLMILMILMSWWSWWSWCPDDPDDPNVLMILMILMSWWSWWS